MRGLFSLLWQFEQIVRVHDVEDHLLWWLLLLRLLLIQRRNFLARRRLDLYGGPMLQILVFIAVKKHVTSVLFLVEVIVRSAIRWTHEASLGLEHVLLLRR